MSKLIVATVVAVALAFVCLVGGVVDGGFMPWAAGTIVAMLVSSVVLPQVGVSRWLGYGLAILVFVGLAFASRAGFGYEDGYDVCMALALGIFSLGVGGLLSSLFAGNSRTQPG
jgi:hypothetical protein